MASRKDRKSTNLPEFESKFLTNVTKRLQQRRKSLKRLATFEWETKQPDEFEWLTLNLRLHGGPYVIVQFTEDHRASVYVRSAARATRGKILYENTDFNVIDNESRIVESLEEILRHAHSLESEPNTSATIDDAVSAIRIRII